MKKYVGFVRKLGVLLLVAWLAIGCMPLDALGAEGIPNTLEAELQEKSGRQDLLPIRDVFVENLEAVTDSKEELERQEESSVIKRSHIYQTDWDRYATHYFYNQLSAGERQLWDQLDAICRTYLTGRADTGSYTAYASYENISTAQMRNVIWLFIYSNPQYYFLEHSYIRSHTQVAIQIYSDFQQGAARYTATSRLLSRMNTLLGEARGQRTAADKMVKLYDAICENVAYDSYVDQGGAITDAYEEQHHTQSIYSALVSGTTVCSGYMKAISALSNALDIDVIPVTSVGHAWNKIRLNGSWYNVDATWDDQDSGHTYVFFEKDDNIICQYDNGSGAHTPEDLWNAVALPACSRNSTANYNTPGTIPGAAGKLQAPVISVQTNGRGNQVTMTAAAGAAIYYTLDGVTPGPGYSKCNLYTGTFSVGGNVRIRAISVRDGYQDSDVASTVSPNVTYTGMLLDSNGVWRYCVNDVIDYGYTGMACNEYGWWYFNNGSLDWNYTGYAQNEYGWWWYQNGQIAWNYTGMVCGWDIWRYVRNGQVDFGYTGMACNEYGWWYFTNGDLNWNYTGMACNEYGWWYYNNGRLDWGYTGYAQNEYGWWWYQNGQIAWNYTGMVCGWNLWRYVRNGQVDFGYTGMACNEYGWWYFTNGDLNWNYTGMACNEYGWWYFTNGNLNWNYTGMACNEYGWWYYNNGRLDWGYTGYGYNEYGRWWYQNGRLVCAA